MKHFIIASILILIFSFAINAQQKEIVFDSENLYHKALNAVLEKRLAEYGDITEKEELTNVTILNEHLTIDLPGKIGSFKIDYLGDEELFAKYKKYRKNKENGKSMRIMKVFPMQNKGSKIEISFTDVHYSRKDTRKGFNTFYALEGGSRVTFGFDCEAEKFIVEDVELWGV